MLRPGDPPPFVAEHETGTAPVVLTCEHAGQAIPAALGDMGIPRADLDRHIGWDPGALGVAQALAAMLDAPLIWQPYSRLVIDCNRPHDAPALTPEISDHTPIPANLNLVAADRRARIEAIHIPFHRKIAEILDARPDAALVAVHSFTPQRRADPAPRPWHCGFLWRQDSTFAEALFGAMQEPGLILAHNQPYEIEDDGDYTIPVHGEARRIPHVLLEIRQDLIATPEGQQRWAARLATALAGIRGGSRGAEPSLPALDAPQISATLGEARPHRASQAAPPAPARAPK